MANPELKQKFAGTVTAVKARIRLLRSFDQISHSYLGYVLVLEGNLDGEPVEQLRVAVGPKAHENHQFRIGDQVAGGAAPVAHEETEWATHYKVSGLQLLERGPTEQEAPRTRTVESPRRCRSIVLEAIGGWTKRSIRSVASAALSG